jgi:uncharacterized protein (DUF1697 family)
MPTYISLIRGINVGGHKKIKMDELRKAVETLGFEQVRTLIQSGNLVFKAAKQAPSSLSRKLEALIAKRFGHEVAVITKTPAELADAIQNNPFLKETGIDLSRLHVTFLSGRPEAADVRKLEAIPSRDDRFHWQGDLLYLHLPNGAGESKLAAAPFEKLLSVQATTRNWNTVNNLHQMAVDQG